MLKRRSFLGALLATPFVGLSSRLLDEESKSVTVPSQDFRVVDHNTLDTIFRLENVDGVPRIVVCGDFIEFVPIYTTFVGPTVVTPA